MFTNFEIKTIMNKISKFLIGLFVIGVTASCSSPMDEITELGINRNFAPVALTAKVVNKTDIKLEWNKSDADSYTIEVFYEDPDFAGSPIKTITGVTNSDIPYTIKGLEGETEYSIRVKAVGGSLSDSKWSIVTTTTDTEQIFYAVDEENDVTESTITVRWPAGATATAIVVTPGDKEFPVTADAIAAGEFTVTGLDAETEYTIKLMNGTKTRGTVKVKTAIDLGGATLVKEGEDLAKAIENAADGDALALMPGQYPINADEAGVGSTIKINKSITLKSVRPYNPAVIEGGFKITSADVSLSFTQVKLQGSTNAKQMITYDLQAETKYGDIAIDGCDISNYASGVIYATNKNFPYIKNITINNSTITKCGNGLIDVRSGVVDVITITNSTLYACSCNNIIRLDKKPGGFTNKGVVATLSNCTLNNVGSNNKGYLYIRQVGSTSICENNIFANNSSAIFTGDKGCPKPAFNNNNYFNTAGLNTVEGCESVLGAGTVGDGKAGSVDGGGTSYNPNFADADKADFTVGSDDVKALKIGDPRWIK